MIATRQIIVLLMAAAVVGGCRVPKASDFRPSKIFSMKSSWPWGDGSEPEEGIPARIVGTWTDTVRSQAGQKPQRGFGGRLVFYGTDEKKPILVDGQLVVYAFNESGRDPADNKPTRRYVFPADQMPLHMSTSDIGASYSFWLPWDEAGGPRTEVSLIARFEPKGGAVITSEQTRHLLPGALSPEMVADAQRAPQLPEGVPSRPARPTLDDLRVRPPVESGAQQTSYEAPAGVFTGAETGSVQSATLIPERRMGVTSIALPDNYKVPALMASPRATAAPLRTASVPAHSPAIQQAAVPAAPIVPAVPRPATTGWPTVPAVAPAPMGVGVENRQLARPQFATPQFMSLQPAPLPTSASAVPTVTQPVGAEAQPMVR